jgi:Icc protein
MITDEERVWTPSRRSVLAGGLVAGLGAVAGGCATSGAVATPQAAAPSRGKAFRVAHLTDVHVEPGALKAGEGFTLALNSLHTQLDRKPDLIVTGGDHVMDANAHARSDADAMWDLYQRVLRDNTDVPVRPCIGNHDVYAWGMGEKVAETEAGYGKGMYLDRMQVPRTYYSFDAGGWHFVCLDNIARRPENPKTYVGELGDEQTEWLRADLAANDKRLPVCVVTHIPLLTATVFFDENPWDDKRHGYNVGDNMLHRNVKPLLLILRDGGAKLCLSGHVHLLDRVEYLGMTFICDGAVCGNWWKGPRQEFPEGYGVLDLYPDGRFTHQYHSYGWRSPALQKA